MNSLKVISINGEEFQMTEDEILKLMTNTLRKNENGLEK